MVGGYSKLQTEHVISCEANMINRFMHGGEKDLRSMLLPIIPVFIAGPDSAKARPPIDAIGFVMQTAITIPKAILTAFHVTTVEWSEVIATLQSSDELVYNTTLPSMYLILLNENTLGELVPTVNESEGAPS